MSDGAGSTELFLALERIKARVEERTRRGDYPLGVDGQLRERFAELVDAGLDPASASAALDDALRRLTNTPPFDRANIQTTSRIPGGTAAHEVVGKVVSRQILGTLQQLQHYRVALEETLVVLVEAYVQASAERDRSLRTSLDRLAEVEDLGARYRTLERRMAAVEAQLADRST
ncbi:MAG: hypothetical protein ABWZ42_11750 [Ilumatobacteraceae bacterium]